MQKSWAILHLFMFCVQGAFKCCPSSLKVFFSLFLNFFIWHWMLLHSLSVFSLVLLPLKRIFLCLLSHLNITYEAQQRHLPQGMTQYCVYLTDSFAKIILTENRTKVRQHPKKNSECPSRSLEHYSWRPPTLTFKLVRIVWILFLDFKIYLHVCLPVSQ